MFRFRKNSKSEKDWGFEILCIRSPGVRGFCANAPLMRTARVLFALCFFVCVVLLCLSCAFLFVLCFFVWVLLLLFELCFFVWVVMLFCSSCAFLFALRFFVCAFSAYVLRFKIYVRFLSLNLFFCAFSFFACVSPFGPKPWCLWMPLHAASKRDKGIDMFDLAFDGDQMHSKSIEIFDSSFDVGQRWSQS